MCRVLVMAAWLALCVCVCAGCAPARRAGTDGEVVGGISLRLENAPATVMEGTYLKMHAVFTNRSGETAYLPAGTMASSPSFRFQKLGPNGQPVGAVIEAPGWCQGILLGDTAVEIPPGGRHSEWLVQDTEVPTEVAAGSTYRVVVSLRYHIRTPTEVTGPDGKVRQVPEEKVWRGEVSSAPFVVAVKPLEVRPAGRAPRRADSPPGPLDRKVSFEFKEAPLAEAAGRVGGLAGLRVTCDEELAQRPVTLRMHNASARTALSWIGMLASPDAELDDAGDGSVRITTKPRLAMIIYDLRDLACCPEVMAEVLKKRVAPETWGRAGRSLVDRNGQLVAVQSRAVHHAIAALLADWRRQIAQEEARRAARKAPGRGQ